MDGIHDLGGKRGYGPVDVNEPEEPFHAPFEGRMWAITRTARTPDIGIDWWRHVRELIDPEDYLNRGYFDSWSQTEMAAMLDAGLFSVDELLSGVSQTPKLGEPTVLDYPQVLAESRDKAYRFDRKVDDAPVFRPDDAVVTAAKGHSGHTRLPEYARGKTGVVLRHHGAHIFPDDAAKGTEIAQHLYTVAFDARVLWGQSAAPHDRVTLELWESYLAPA